MTRKLLHQEACSVAEMYTNRSRNYQNGRKRCLDYQDDGCSKKFCCEESMSLHMQQLFIAASSSPRTPPLEGRGMCCHSRSTWWPDSSAIMADDDDITNSDTSGSSQHTTLWVAPEVKEVINNNAINLLPKKILKDIERRPCLALVPYIDHMLASRQPVWSPATSQSDHVTTQSDHVTTRSDHVTTQSDQVDDDDDELCDYIDDDMDVL